MRKSVMVLAGVAAMMMPAMASAQAQKVDPFVIDENTMMGRQPRVAADKLVGPNTGGELLKVRGKAWWQVLSWCAGVYRFRFDSLREAGDETGAEPIEQRGKFFIELALGRIMTDRDIDGDTAVDILVPEIQYANASAADGGEEFRPFKVDEMRCNDVERFYRAAGLADD